MEGCPHRLIPRERAAGRRPAARGVEEGAANSESSRPRSLDQTEDQRLALR